MYILGISAFFHDSAACLIDDGKVVAAAQEERFSRIKHDASFPVDAIRFCLSHASITPGELSFVVFYEKPFLKFERLLETYLAFAPKGFSSFRKAMPLWIKEKVFQKKNLITMMSDSIDQDVDWHSKLLFSSHHLSHAASAFFPSPFKEAAVLTMDGVGEWATTSIYTGRENSLSLTKELNFPHSLGLLYSAFTYYAGFKVNSGEYKLMGLAPYGNPIYYDTILDNIIHVSPDGSYQLDMKYFEFATGLQMTSSKFHDLFGGLPRKPESLITQKEMDIAASIQKVIEFIVLKIARHIKEETNLDSLCLAGGVALNCVANGLIVKENIFENVWVQPASGDAGGALGAALAAWHIELNKKRNVNSAEDAMRGSFLGPEYSDRDIETQLVDCGAKFEKRDHQEMIADVAAEVAAGSAVGWMQGRMEFGPRALGGRSILADPRSEKMQKTLNLKVKFRESFRPFAPSVLVDEVANWFELEEASPYMLLVAQVKSDKLLKEDNDQDALVGFDRLKSVRSSVPAITHIDNSARIQTVKRSDNPAYFDLIKKFHELTGCPLLVNTSFNVRGEPIVCTPEDAFRCFMGNDLDLLVIGDFILYKKDQDSRLRAHYKNDYELD